MDCNEYFGFMEGRSVGLYVHIPFCLSKCAYCDFFSVPSHQKVPDDYISALCHELSFAFEGRHCTVDSVYIGGGTPSLLSFAQIDVLLGFLRSCVPLSGNAEITVEVNPDDVSEPLLAALQKNGVNRISCGIQSLADEALAFCGRRASRAVNEKALNLIKNFWQGDVSLDVICGLPNETELSFMQGLSELCDYKPSHISMYSLTIEDGTPLGKMLHNGSVRYDYDFADELWLKGRDFLESHGYGQYEVSNFSLAGKECRHNLKYWSRGDYAGCGSGAAGTLYFPSGAGIRRQNENNIERYVSFWGRLKNQPEKAFFDDEVSEPCLYEELSRTEGEVEFFMMGLRKVSGFCLSEYKRAFDNQLPDNVQSLFESWQKKGLAVIQKTGNDVRYSLGKRGIMYLNSFLAQI